MTEEQTQKEPLRQVSLEIGSREQITSFYYSASEVFDWLRREDSNLAAKWIQKMAIDQNASQSEKCDSLVNVIEHASECLADIAPPRSKKKKIAKEISTLINTIIE